MEKIVPLESMVEAVPHFPVSAFDVSVGEVNYATSLWGLGTCGSVFSADTDGSLQLHPLPEGLEAETIYLDPHGVPWVLANSSRNQAATLAEHCADNDSWRVTELDFGCRSFAVTETGDKWLVDDLGQVRRIDNDGRDVLVSEKGEDFARSIAYRQGHRIWVIGAQERFGGFVVYNLPEESHTWFALPAPASAAQLAIGPDGVAWTINAHGEVWRLHPNGGGSLRECQVFTGCIKCRFATRNESSTNVACGPDGVVWVTKNSETDGERRAMFLRDAMTKSFNEVPLSIEIATLAGSSS